MKRLVLLCALTLPGCAGHERLEAQKAAEARQAQYHARCLEYGFTAGSEAYGQCRQNFDVMEAQDRALKRSAILQRMLLR